MANAFMKSAARSKYEQASIQKTDDGGTRSVSIRIPAEIHRKAAIHRIETGESMTKLVCRLLAEELGE